MSRGYAWIGEDAEHSEEDEVRAEALARRWSRLHDEEEQRAFRRQADDEDGRSRDFEPDECSRCDGSGFMGVERGRSPLTQRWSIPDWAVGIRCTNPDCEDGYDMGPMREEARRERVLDAERRLEVELLEDKLAAVGARMMRPYEHWNEDERLMEYLERDR